MLVDSVSSESEDGRRQQESVDADSGPVEFKPGSSIPDIGQQRAVQWGGEILPVSTVYLFGKDATWNCYLITIFFLCILISNCTHILIVKMFAHIHVLLLMMNLKNKISM